MQFKILLSISRVEKIINEAYKGKLHVSNWLAIVIGGITYSLAPNQLTKLITISCMHQPLKSLLILVIIMCCSHQVQLNHQIKKPLITLIEKKKLYSSLIDIEL